MIDYDELAQEAHKAAVAKGFWGNPVSDEQAIVLIISELMDAVEADRKGYRADRSSYETALAFQYDTKTSFEKYVKGTFEDEIADMVISICDLAGARNVSLLPSFQFVARENFFKNVYDCCYILTVSYTNLRWTLGMALAFCRYVAEEYDFDLAWFVREKMKYNETRPRLNGKRH